MRHALLCLLLILTCNAGSAGEEQIVDPRLQPILDDYWDLYLSSNPTDATWLGKNEFNDRLPSVTPENLAEVTQGYRALSRRLAPGLFASGGAMWLMDIVTKDKEKLV